MVKIGLVVLEKDVENVKSLCTDGRQTKCYRKISGELKPTKKTKQTLTKATYN